MRALSIGVFLSLFAFAASARELVTLSCSGAQIVSDDRLQADGTWQRSSTNTGFDATILVDADAQTLTLNGRPMVVRQFNSNEVVFGRLKSKALTIALSQSDYILDRRTGVLRFGGGSGQCRRVDTAPVF